MHNTKKSVFTRYKISTWLSGPNTVTVLVTVQLEISDNYTCQAMDLIHS